MCNCVNRIYEERQQYLCNCVNNLNAYVCVKLKGKPS